MGKISKSFSIKTGKNINIDNIINTKEKIKEKKSIKKIKIEDEEYGSDVSNESEFDEENEDNESLNDNENQDIQDDEENYNVVEDKDGEEYSEKESNDGENEDKDEDVGDEEKNYIDDEETLKTKCYSQYAKVDYEDLDFDEIFGDESDILGKNIRVSKPVLTKYEFVRLLTDRTKQLAQGAKHMLKNTQELSSKEIAKLEIKEGVIPLIIERPIPNSKNERWKISELHIPEHFFSM